MENNNKTSPKFSAEFTMGELDYQRFHELLTLADRLRVELLSSWGKDASMVRAYFSVLDTFFVNILFLIRNFGLDVERNEIIKLMQEWEKRDAMQGKRSFPVELAQKLLDFHQKLLFAKQVVGLGIKIQRVESLKKRLARVADIE
jgi:acid phosphatase class B